MRFLAALFLLSATSIVLAQSQNQCAKCDHTVNSDEGEYNLVVAVVDDDHATTFCGYVKKGSHDEGFCSYYNFNQQLSDLSENLHCPEFAGVEEC
ncbi:hypothetical protein B0H12DRAFT_1117162 [Mycena haematopus]|nr:hypothetical protein B0H12DRAFT_1117162 [Mycena haematopus]